MTFNTIAFSKGFFRTGKFDINTISDEEVVLLMNGNTSIAKKVLNVQLELMRFGYMLDSKSLVYLSRQNDEVLSDFAESVVDYLIEITGDGQFITLFGDFPNTVLSMTEEEMFIHQIIHYLSGGLYSPAMPHCDDQELVLLEYRYSGRVLKDHYKVLVPKTDAELCEYFKSVLSAQQSLTSVDKANIEYLCKNYRELTDDMSDVFPAEIPFKETLCIVIANNSDYKAKTINDVLRYTVYLSNGDVSLPALPKGEDFGWSSSALLRMSSHFQEYWNDRIKQLREPYKFKKFSRAERKQILCMMENILATDTLKHGSIDYTLADMKKYLGKWIRLGEILHPGDYVSQFPMTCNAFTVIRNAGQYISTYYSKVEAARKSGDLDAILKVFSERPGEFARNLDSLIRSYSSNAKSILDAFSKVTDRISTKMLYELLEHFYTRNDIEDLGGRFVITKHANTRAPYKLPATSKIESPVVYDILTALTSELSKRFAAKDSLENKTFYIDEKLENITLPKGMRTANASIGQLPRGSRIPISTNTGLFRCYVRWIDKAGNIDLDLAAAMYDKNFNHVANISWNTNYSLGGYAIFSGDVRCRRGNCAEYIDIDIDKALKSGVRYVVTTVYDYNGGGFTYKDAWAGIMERSSFGTPGEVTWAPETISTGFRLTSACTNIIMGVLDLKERCIYVADEDITGIPVNGYNNIGYDTLLKRYILGKHYFNASKLIVANCNARGAAVCIESADSILKRKEEVEAKKKEIRETIDTYIKLIETVDEVKGFKSEVLMKKLEDLKDAYEVLENEVFITYDDLASDYTRLLEWMF